jgi:N4-gp56 family major capsid protein
MATQNQTISAAGNQLSAENAEYYQRVLLDRLKPELMLVNYGEKGMGIPKKAGDTASWRRYNSLAVNTTALTEGVTPDGINASVTKVSATVKQYGAFIQTTDFLDLVGLDDNLTQFSELMGENGGESIETIVRDVVCAGTNVVYANSRASRVTVAAGDNITIADILKIRRTFKRNKVKGIKLPNGKTGYLAFAHTDVITDLMKTQEWKDMNTYVSTENRIEGVAGQLYGIYFIEYDLANKFTGAGAASIDVFCTLVIGKGAFGVPDINGSSKPEIIVKGLGSAGSADPLNQRATVARHVLIAA